VYRELDLKTLLRFLCVARRHGRRLTCFPRRIGLVTDIGSITAHEALAAREYCIPALLGVANGTKRIAHDQVISVDGDVGTVTINE
ncbi:MAG TPA: PEP-utilizing enzyme, partial [Arenicellales bacterium]|nr:PEP-utilizing enzyme [Arenicellales bacterium]